MVLALALAVLAVHDLGYLLRHPFWTDEEWVAVTTRFPLTELPRVTSSTPIGWSALLRLVPFGGKQDLRLVPLAFAGATVAAAYWFARRLGWAHRGTAVGAGLLAALGALLVPAMLVRNDLKQYTADAFLALLVLAQTSRVERGWRRRELAVLGCAVAGGMLFSDAAAFVGIAAFTALAVIQLSRRAWRALLEAVVAGAATAIGMVAVYLTPAPSSRGLLSIGRAITCPRGRGLGPACTSAQFTWTSSWAILGSGHCGWSSCSSPPD